LSPLAELPVPHNHQKLQPCLGMSAYCTFWIKTGKMKPFTANSGAFLPQGAAFAAFEKLQSELLDAWLGCIDK